MTGAKIKKLNIKPGKTLAIHLQIKYFFLNYFQSSRLFITFYLVYTMFIDWKMGTLR